MSATTQDAVKTPKPASEFLRISGVFRLRQSLPDSVSKRLLCSDWAAMTVADLPDVHRSSQSLKRNASSKTRQWEVPRLPMSVNSFSKQVLRARKNLTEAKHIVRWGEWRLSTGAREGRLAYRMTHDTASYRCIVDAGSEGYELHRRQCYVLEGRRSTRKFNACS